MITDTITAIAKAAEKAFGAAIPYIEESVAQRYEKEHQQRMQVFAKIMAHGDTDRAGALDLFVREQLAKAGVATTGISTGTLRVPVDCFAALISELSEGIKKDAMLARIQFKKE